MTDELPSDEAKLGDRCVLVKEPKEKIYDQENVQALPASHPTSIVSI